jgi:hypothetical protein
MAMSENQFRYGIYLTPPADSALHVDALTLLGQGEPGGEFRILHRFPHERPHRSRRSTRALASAIFD